jgi:glycosyltransferase involved in cell wall biosynthesis
LASVRIAPIRVGLTEKHGMAIELSKYPPPGVEYSFIKPTSISNRFIRSKIKGYLGNYNTKENDIIEAILSPVLTNGRWVYSLANFQEATAFGLLGFPLPRTMRVAYLKSLLLKDNFKKLIFWSHAGKETLRSYGRIEDCNLLKKITVVYPAVRMVPDKLIHFNHEDVRILFSGDFFRKGGVNVIDAFELAQRIYPTIKLILCCDENIDFYTQNTALKEEYIKKIRSNNGIIFCGRVPRDELINTILPRTDIYLLPTYVEAFGFALLEAMAYGIPVISTNYFAIPEIIEHNVCGYLIDTSKYECDKLFKGYIVNDIPSEFKNYMTDNLYVYLCRLIESVDLREKFGKSGLEIARSKFSFDERNKKMLEIYREALG